MAGRTFHFPRGTACPSEKGQKKPNKNNDWITNRTWAMSCLCPGKSLARALDLLAGGERP